MTNSLKNTFKQRTLWKNNRSSAIYPIDIIENSNFIFLFINYWKLKNKIKSLNCIITLFRENGSIKEKKKYNIKKHNEISLKKFFKINNFRGMVQIEFISKENLRFPFPAVTGLYMSPAGYPSAVHSAGRILNKNEFVKKENIQMEESNFSFKYSLKEQITPFFSLYKSDITTKKDEIKIYLKDEKKNNLEIKKLKNLLQEPYSNKIFYLDKIFNNQLLKKSKYCVVRTNFNKVFSRMICGNFFKKIHHYEVTHSYSVQKNKKDIIDDRYSNDKEVNHMSFLPFVKSKKTKLSIRIFPTNLSSNLKGNLLIYDKEKNRLMKNKKIDFNPKNNFKEIKFDKKDKIFGCISLKQKKIPSRINASYIYNNENKNKITTDTALGFKSIEYPAKKTHWGSIYLDKKIKTELLIRKILCNKGESISDGKIIFFNNQMRKEINIILNNDDYKIINIEKELKEYINHKVSSVSWIATFTNPSGIEIFWNSISKNFIFGDHSF